MAESSGVRVEERVLVSCREGKTKDVSWEKGTVRYVGTVRDQAGEWLGIEWDNPTRGKHDGQFEGHRYFTCRTQKWNPSPASFVREKRIRRGASLVETVRDKYCGGVSQDLECEMFIHTSSNLRLPVTLVGQDSIVKQQSVLEELKAVYLNGSTFSSMGAKGEISQTIPRVTDLDLSDSLLSSWQEVTKLSDELPNLQLLDISRNEIGWAKPLPLPSGPIFENLRSLVLNNCYVDWETVMSIAVKTQKLCELHVAGNSIKSLACENNICSCLGTLEALHLEDNLIQDWSEVKRLSALPRLKKLNLSGNLLAEIESYSVDNKPGFALLTTLFLQSNSLKDWKDIDTLNHFESLTEVRVSGMPLFDGLDMINSRQGVTARLPRLLRLNGSTVTQKERVDAEIDYLSAVLTESVGKEIKEIAAKHPRFPALLKSYGNINVNMLPSSKASNDRTTISKTLLSLELSLVADLQDVETIKSVKKKLPSNLTLSKFKTLCQRLLGVSASSQVVYVKRDDPEATYEELIHDEDTLQQLGVCDGNCVRILES